MGFASNMLRAWRLQEKTHEYLRRQEKKHDTAEKLGLKRCTRCGFCCLKRPCVPAPSELEEIANYLGITPQQLATRFMVADKQEGSNIFLRFATKSQQLYLGQFIPWKATYGRGYCLLYDKKNKKCLIYPVRPKSAKWQKCWVTEEKATEDKRVKANRNGFARWDKEDVLKFLPNINLSDCSD